MAALTFSSRPGVGPCAWWKASRGKHCGTRRETPPGGTSLLPHELRHAAQVRFGGIDVARGVDGDAFAHGAVRGIRHHVRRYEHRHLPVFETSNADSALPARVNFFRRLRIGRVNYVILVDGQPTG